MSEHQWFLNTSEGQMGPYSTADIQRMLNMREITAGYHVWRDGLPEWVQIGDLEEFAQREQHFRKGPASVTTVLKRLNKRHDEQSEIAFCEALSRAPLAVPVRALPEGVECGDYVPDPRIGLRLVMIQAPHAGKAVPAFTRPHLHKMLLPDHDYVLIDAYRLLEVLSSISNSFYLNPGAETSHFFPPADLPPLTEKLVAGSDAPEYEKQIFSENPANVRLEEFVARVSLSGKTNAAVSAHRSEFCDILADGILILPLAGDPSDRFAYRVQEGRREHDVLVTFDADDGERCFNLYANLQAMRRSYPEQKFLTLRGATALGMIENGSFKTVSIHTIRERVVLNAEEFMLATTIPSAE